MQRYCKGLLSAQVNTSPLLTLELCWSWTTPIYDCASFVVVTKEGSQTEVGVSEVNTAMHATIPLQ